MGLVALASVEGKKKKGNCKQITKRFNKCVKKGFGGNKCEGSSDPKELKGRLAKRCNKLDKKFSKKCNCGKEVNPEPETEPETVEQELASNQMKYYEMDLDREVAKMELKKQHSNSPCTLNESFGFSGTKVWVNKGCRGTFVVTFVANGGVGSEEEEEEEEIENWMRFSKTEKLDQGIPAGDVEHYKVKTPCKGVWFKLFLIGVGHIEIYANNRGNVFCKDAGNKSWWGGEKTDFSFGANPICEDGSYVYTVDRTTKDIKISNSAGETIFSKTFGTRDGKCLNSPNQVKTQVWTDNTDLYLSF